MSADNVISGSPPYDNDSYARRSREGCWTCKRVHKKCDEQKPFCGTCRRSNRECEGYELRLVWLDPNPARNVPKRRGKRPGRSSSFRSSGLSCAAGRSGNNISEPRDTTIISNSEEQNSYIPDAQVVDNAVEASLLQECKFSLYLQSHV